MPDLNSMQSTIKDLQNIVDKNQGADHESALLLKQIQELVADIEQKARQSKKSEPLIMPPVQPIQVSF